MDMLTNAPATMPAEAAPDVEFRVADDVVVLNDPQGGRAEALAALRTHIMAQHLRVGRRSLALCAPNAGVGCTTIAVNLAVSLAQVGVKTLLIDADMRRPSVHKHLAPSREVPGLVQCLGDDAVGFGDAIQAEVLPDLSLIYAGGRADKPQELLAGARFKALLDLCLRDYDLTIVDTPPASASADARRIASVVGHALMVVGRDQTFVSDVKVLAEELEADRVRVIGSVLNGD